MTTAANGCVPCGMEQADDDAIVFRDPLWACGVIPGFDVPGWFVLRVRRHALRLGGLSDDELSTYGRRARDLVDAVTEVTGAPATYVLTFGEADPHFHSLIAARGEEVPPERRMAAILNQRDDRRDAAAAKTLVPAVSAAYARRAERVGVDDVTAGVTGAVPTNPRERRRSARGRRRTSRHRLRPDPWRDRDALPGAHRARGPARRRVRPAGPTARRPDRAGHAEPPELVESLWAAFRGGFVAVPPNWHLHPDEVAYTQAQLEGALGDSQTRLLGGLRRPDRW